VNFDVAVNGRAWKVAVETVEPGRITVTVRGRRRVLDVSWIDADTVSLIEGSVAREARIHRRGDGVLGIEIGGDMFSAVVSKGGRTGADRSPAAGSLLALVKAPMPGRIVSVLVAKGDRVTARQPVVVIEAMKMENELRSPREGTVKEVVVVAGATVEAGIVLVVIE